MDSVNTSAAIVISSAYASRPSIAWKSYFDGVYATVQWEGHTVHVKIAEDRTTRYTDFEDEDPDTEYYGAIAEVAIAGEIIGYDSLWGIGVERGTRIASDPYLAIECVWGCVDQAIAGIPVHVPAVLNKLTEELEAAKVRVEFFNAAIASIAALASADSDRAASLGYPMLTSLYRYYPEVVALRAARDGAASAAPVEADHIAADIYFRDPPRA